MDSLACARVALRLLAPCVAVAAETEHALRAVLVVNPG